MDLYGWKSEGSGKMWQMSPVSKFSSPWNVVWDTLWSSFRNYVIQVPLSWNPISQQLLTKISNLAFYKIRPTAQAPLRGHRRRGCLHIRLPKRQLQEIAIGIATCVPRFTFTYYSVFTGFPDDLYHSSTAPILRMAEGLFYSTYHSFLLST